MEIRARGDMVFDLNALRNERQTKESEKTGRTYSVFDSDIHSASPENPVIVLDNKAGLLRHHQTGVFNDPARRTAFSYKDGDSLLSADILRTDSRFTALLGWLGENQVRVRLSGRATDEGYAVYKIHAVNLMGNIQSGTDGFLQMTIGRLLAGNAPEMPEDTDEDADSSGLSEDSDPVRLTDISGMTDFLQCAGFTLPPNIRKWASHNLALIRSGAVGSDEKRHAQRALSMVLNIEWKSTYFESVDPVRARKILDDELYGMEEVKQRIIETIIQINRTHTLPSYGILLAGPAGVGKSQLAYAVARILKLPWAALDMSAIHDPEALTGSPRVYANAKPGIIMETFSRAGESNVVFIINELDKADSGESGGNPADALLTLLDNLGYTDNYIECTIPTGGVYPIATANDKSRISAPLMSRFAVIDIPDYTADEKRVIFSKYSLPKVLKRMGMRRDECEVPEDAVSAVIERFEGTTGCRDLEQAAEHLAANALYRLETEHISHVRYDAGTVRRLLG